MFLRVRCPVCEPGAPSKVKTQVTRSLICWQNGVGQPLRGRGNLMRKLNQFYCLCVTPYNSIIYITIVMQILDSKAQEGEDDAVT